MKKILLLLLIGTSAQAGFAQSLNANELRKHVEVLAADSLEGRGTATVGEIKAANYIAESFRKYGLVSQGRNGDYFQPFGLMIPFEGVPHQVTARNVVGYLDNGAAKTIVIGAHYDHLGRGYQMGSLASQGKGVIHNGADDNASGTAGMMELARYLAGNGVKERHNFLFIAFSGEELGLLGSKYYLENPTVPLTSISFMINLDMIGRLDTQRGLTIGGWGTSPTWGKVVPALARQDNMKFAVDSSGVGASDHTSFYLKGIPVLFFFTGVHSDYHKPTDDTDKINIDGTVRVVRLIANLITKVEEDTAEPQFTPAGNPHSGMTQSSFKVTLGVMPDYAYSGKGLKIDGVLENRPAQTAGIQAGDVVVRMGEYPVQDIQDYMKALGKFEKGQTAEVEVQRGGDRKVLKVTF
ncbi:M20/M25/M40 family metallo-hydrolase [Telluribacter sp. SYSU D00476]|uniref:M20/M25/M40 family metallo-hydrolase n=1 Tax=Telluribacter sp. SYSU D00476 TaxID=2811430 RepID=UPI001FF4C20B|nr:M20/M25/M40 family metallo-hydrolase [Telluribacter sp. SYSU D00476]